MENNWNTIEEGTHRGLLDGTIENHECDPQEDCPECRGDRRCTKCHGSGDVDCHVCHGNGQCREHVAQNVEGTEDADIVADREKFSVGSVMVKEKYGLAAE